MERIIKTLAILTVLVFATSTSALALSFAEVGGSYDAFKAAANISPSNDANETQWIADQYNKDASTLSFTKWPNAEGWAATSDGPGGTHYFDFGTDNQPFAFLIKGASTDALTYSLNGVTATGSHILFTNLTLLQYGVINFDWLTGPNGNDFTLETISHTSATGGGTIPPDDVVPEPSTLALLGLGLVGLAVYRRKKN